jgi:hypothetical protein
MPLIYSFLETVDAGRGNFDFYPNQSVRYANHQLAIPIGIVAASAHHNGSAISAISPSSANVAQKIFFCILLF